MHHQDLASGAAKRPPYSAAIIGISNYGRNHLLMAMEQMLQGKLRLLAATVVNQAEEAIFCARLRRLGCEIFKSDDEMWAAYHGRIDLCFIPTGIHLHATMAIRAMRAGAAVLLEKPLAASVEQARQIMAAERETGRFVAVGFQDFYVDSTWKIKEWVLGGRLGKLQSASFVGLWPRSSSYYSRNSWAGRLAHHGLPVHDSPVSNAFGHFLNLALFWAGPDLATSASVQRLECELYRTRRIESFDTCCARAALSGGCELNFYLTHSCPRERKASVILTGSEATLAWSQESHFEIVRSDGTVERHAIPGKFETRFLMADAVTAMLSGAAAFSCTTASALEHLRLVEAMHAASPIHDIAEDALQAGGDPSEGRVAIAGIEEICDRARRERALWSEIGVPWASRPSVYPVP